MKHQVYDPNNPTINWNMTKAALMRLDRRLEERDTAEIERDLPQWFRCLMNIYGNCKERFLQKLEEKEVNELWVELKAAEATFRNPPSSPPSANQPTRDKVETVFFQNTEDKLRELSIKLNSMIVRAGLLFIKRDEKTIEQLAEEDYQ